ncbi:hypothetical protein [Dokdonia sp.]|uniref:hypothetical protein n=1 Tax=Dokdonia sp. TaxID=2024995 RepID=UPI0032642969
MNIKKQHIIFLSIASFVLLSSCAQKSIDPNIVLFQQELGKENIAMIDLLIEEFEDHLHKHYSDLTTTEAYTQLLKDISDQDTRNDSILVVYQSEKSLENFRASSLYKELYTKEPLHQKIEGIPDLYIPPPPSTSLNKEIAIPEPDSIYVANPIGKYMRALYAIKDRDSLVKNFFRVKEASGIMASNRFAKGILYYNPDFDNYIHKRIVVLENSF